MDFSCRNFEHIGGSKSISSNFCFGLLETRKATTFAVQFHCCAAMPHWQSAQMPMEIKTSHKLFDNRTQIHCSLCCMLVGENRLEEVLYQLKCDSK